MADNEDPRPLENASVPWTDLDLARGARRGDTSAFHELVDRYASQLYGLACGMVAQEADAEDVVQETLAGAYRGLRTFREASSVKTWLTRILIRQAARHFRQGKARRIEFVDIDDVGEPRLGSATAAADVRMDVRSAIWALRQEHREVIVLREMQGLSYGEIAKVLEVPVGTVESRLFRARRELQGLLKDYLP